MESDRPIRVLHGSGGLVKGGTETWLMNLLRLRPKELQFDFFLSQPGGAYEAEARSYGCRIHHAPRIRQFRKNLRFLEDVLKTNRYDVFHTHGDEFMGDAVRIAAKVGVPVRIVHCHNTRFKRGKEGFEMRVRLWRHRTIDRSYMLRHATDILGCSNDAGRYLMGRHWGIDSRCRTLYCGVPLENFSRALSTWSRDEFRMAHGIPKDAIVVGHVGSMGPTPQKNHPFIIKVFAELARLDQRYHLYLAGDGPNRPALEEQIRELGLQSRVMMPGPCDDVPSLMVHGFDVHLVPSLWEGLPIVGLEAVASGLFTVCSDSITKDYTGRFPDRITAMSLGADTRGWAKKVAEGVGMRLPAQEGMALVRESPFSIQESLRNLLDVYRHRLQPQSSIIE
jgi:glycosyltransferase EpsF